MMRKSFVGIVIGLVVGVATGLFLPLIIEWLAERPALRRVAAKKQDASLQNPSKATGVAVAVVEPAFLKDALVLMGTIEPWEDITVSAEVSGKLEWQGVEAGDAVSTGQEMIKVDTEAIRARLDQAKARYRFSVQELERVRGLAKSGISSSQDYDRVRAEHDVAQAELRTAEIQLEKSTVTAPIDGVVDTLYREQGEFVDMGAPLIRLVQVRQLKVLVGIPERDIAWFSVGDSAQVAIDAFPGRDIVGMIHRIATTAEPATRTFATDIHLDNPSGKLKPGMIARTELVRQEFPNAILAPFFSVITREGAQAVFVERDGVAQMRPIETGVAQGGYVQVTRGLAPGDRLIVVGQRDLRDGEPVEVREAIQ